MAYVKWLGQQGSVSQKQKVITNINRIRVGSYKPNRLLRVERAHEDTSARFISASNAREIQKMLSVGKEIGIDMGRLAASWDQLLLEVQAHRLLQPLGRSQLCPGGRCRG